jgi:hypothetical protein
MKKGLCDFSLQVMPTDPMVLIMLINYLAAAAMSTPTIPASVPPMLSPRPMHNTIAHTVREFFINFINFFEIKSSGTSALTTRL